MGRVRTGKLAVTGGHNGAGTSGIISASYFDRIADGVFVVARDWTYVFVNAAGAALIGLTPRELVGRNMWEVFPLSLGSRFEQECHRAMDQREPVELEQRGPNDDQCSVIRVFPSDQGLTVYYEDVTRQRLSERALADAQQLHVEALAREAQLARDAETRLRRVLDGITEGVSETTLDGQIVTINQGFATMLGYASPEEMIAEVPDVGVLYADVAQRAALIAAAESADDDLTRTDIEFRARDGHSVWVRARLRLRRVEGEAIGVHIIAEDVNATRSSEAQIREAEERLHFAFHDNPMPLVVIEFTAPGGIITEANAALEALLGYAAGELVGADVDAFVPGEDFGNASVVAPFANDNVRVTFETRARHRDGHFVPVAATAVTIQSATGRWYATAAIEDITARRAGEEATRAANDLLEARADADQALADLARLTLESADIAAFGRTACGLVARVLDVDFCSILLPGETGGLEIVAEWGWDRRLLATVDSTPAPESQAAHSFAHGVSVIVDDWLTETRFTRSPLLDAHDVHSGVSVAIRYDQATIGVIGVQSRPPRLFDDTALRFLESVAQLVGVALEQDRVQRRLAQSERTLQSIVDNAPVAIHVVDPKGRFLLVNRELERIIGTPRDLLIGRTRAEVPRLADGASIAGLVDDLEALQQRTPVATERTATEADGVHSYLSVDFPLLDSDGVLYGVGGISTDVTELVRSRAETTAAWLESMDRLVRAVEVRDDATGAHIERMAAYSALIAHVLGFSDERCAQIRAAAPMHDIGKMAIPDRVLLKPGALTPEERGIMDTHADIGFRLLTGSGSEVLELSAVIARSHHERFDGSGYPLGLVGADIPIEGRIVAIADSFDALTSDRVYRAAMPITVAIDVMRSEAGHFDPEILDAFVENLDLAERLWTDYHVETQRPTAGDHAPLT